MICKFLTCFLLVSICLTSFSDSKWVGPAFKKMIPVRGYVQLNNRVFKLDGEKGIKATWAQDEVKDMTKSSATVSSEAPEVLQDDDKETTLAAAPVSTEAVSSSLAPTTTTTTTTTTAAPSTLAAAPVVSTLSNPSKTSSKKRSSVKSTYEAQTPHSHHEPSKVHSKTTSKANSKTVPHGKPKFVSPANSARVISQYSQKGTKM